MTVVYILIWFLELILSLKQKDVSECVCLSINYYEMADPNELKFWGMIPLGDAKNPLIRPNIRRKIEKKNLTMLATIFYVTAFFSYRISPLWCDNTSCKDRGSNPG